MASYRQPGYEPSLVKSCTSYVISPDSALYIRLTY